MPQLPLLSETDEDRLRFKVLELDLLSKARFRDWERSLDVESRARQDELWEAHEHAHREWVEKLAELKQA